VQLISVPSDMTRYYPSNYYSFGEITYKYYPFKIWLKKKLIKYKVYKQKTIIGKLLSFIYNNSEEFYPWLEKIKPSFDAAILDVGCGSGQLLLKLRKSGFKNVCGADPFIEKDIKYEGGVTINKKSLNEVSGQYDLIIFNHSLEHMPDQQETLRQAYNLLKNHGYVVVSVPVAGTFAWRTYGVNWVQLDAPRHFFLHTINSMKLLGAQVGFGRVDTTFISNDLQFWGSEQYLKNIPLRDKRSYAELCDDSLFTKEQITSYRDRSEMLNRQNDGDAVCFILHKN
jgi:SAM-dependent methyltransferase